MGKPERDRFEAELRKLAAIEGPEETDEYYEQNARTWAAEKDLGWAERLWVRGKVD